MLKPHKDSRGHDDGSHMLSPLIRPKKRIKVLKRINARKLTVNASILGLTAFLVLS